MKKENRIKKSHEIASIVNSKVKVSNKNFVIYYKQTNNEQTRIAFSVSKKFGQAYERNRAKRISRNILRKYVNTYKRLELVVIIRQNHKFATFEELEKEVEFLFKLINKYLNKGGK